MAKYYRKSKKFQRKHSASKGNFLSKGVSTLRRTGQRVVPAVEYGVNKVGNTVLNTADKVGSTVVNTAGKTVPFFQRSFRNVFDLFGSKKTKKHGKGSKGGKSRRRHHRK